MKKSFGIVFTVLAVTQCAWAVDPSTLGPFGPEIACYQALQNFPSQTDSRPSQYASSKMMPMEEDAKELNQPTIGLEQPSADGKSLILRFFTAAGEFDTVIPKPAHGLYEKCIDGISYAGGKIGHVLYENFEAPDPDISSAPPSSIQGDLKDCATLPAWQDQVIVAHQVGQAHQGRSTALLDSEIGILVQSVRPRWQASAQKASELRYASSYRARRARQEGILPPLRPYDPKQVKAREDASKAALRQCKADLKGPEFESLRALITDELSRFDKPAGAGTDSQLGGSSNANGGS